MEYAAPPSYLVTRPLKAVSGYRFRERRDRPLCHLMVRQQTWQGLKSQITQPSPLVCGCGNRGSDFQVWRSLPGVICRPVISRSGSLGQQWRAICFALGQYRPSHASHLIGQCNGRHLSALTGCELGQPRAQAGRLLGLLQQDRMCSLHKELS